MKKISIIIPSYNEVETLPKLVSSLLELYATYAEIIVIDDGSVDETSSIIEGMDCTLIRHPKNLGKGMAIRTGLMTAKTEIVVFIDADGQDDPRDLKRIVEELHNGADVVIGSRFLNESKRTRGAVFPINYLGNMVLTKMICILFGVKITDSQASIKCFKKEFLDSLKLTSVSYEIESEMLIKAAKSRLVIKEIPVNRYKRVAGFSNLFDVPFGRWKFAFRVLRIMLREIK